MVKLIQRQQSVQHGRPEAMSLLAPEPVPVPVPVPWSGAQARTKYTTAKIVLFLIPFSKF